MNAMNQIADARATALSLRASAKACTREQGALKFRLMRAAESLDAMVLLAVRGFDKTNALLIATQFAANHECEFDASDAVAAIIVRVEQTITTLDRLCLEASQ
jgi:hypothetical protein